MNKRAWWEYRVLSIVLVLFAVALFPALQHMRREIRDGIRREEVAQAKRDLEAYFNEYAIYPLSFDAGPHHYVVTDTQGVGAAGWYVRAKLENFEPNQADFDFEEGRNYYFRIVNSEGATYYDVCGGTLTCDAASLN